MGLLAADLERLKSFVVRAPGTKVASARPGPVEALRASLESYAGALVPAEKTASAEDHARLWTLHEGVEAAYREAARLGKRAEADAALDKFSGWTYLKGRPSEPGDLHPLPAPAER